MFRLRREGTAIGLNEQQQRQESERTKEKINNTNNNSGHGGLKTPALRHSSFVFFLLFLSRVCETMEGAPLRFEAVAASSPPRRGGGCCFLIITATRKPAVAPTSVSIRTGLAAAFVQYTIIQQQQQQQIQQQFTTFPLHRLYIPPSIPPRPPAPPAGRLPTCGEAASASAAAAVAAAASGGAVPLAARGQTPQTPPAWRRTAGRGA